ncbi:UDP-3-O-(3-hydroxymyristoyl)glucosamine N-acyltransferase [uncultured Roseobacter sp.]|uniref:UDP-3-O-(3-hydroxymyristoyl)glucosamine N-acyltransferase n=1 Tax=uncultured Roseobacter sp. TaxID=114847 RepID=UPI00261EEB32|nr:UDP-3-O-(3-hydroxymyristoyl)glucosamine N-acyltransferase [uncultured Roseobacter sp.]
MTHYTVRQIAEAIGADVFGDADITVKAVAEPQSAGPDDLAMATRPQYAGHLPEGRARAAMLWPDADWQSMGLEAAIIPDRPRYAMAGLTKMMDRGQGFGAGIHPGAIVAEDAQIGTGVSIGPFTVIAPGARIGNNTIIGPHCYIGQNSTIGAESYLREHVSIGARVTAGQRLICQPGCRVGGDGFSFTTPEVSAVEKARSTLGDQQEAAAQPWARIHSLGGITIGDDVEIGSNATIDCGTIRDTVIGNGSKLDNLVHLGHNVVVGEDCLLCGQVGIAGSVTIGNNVVLGGQVGVSDNIFIGDRVIAGGGTKILSNVPAGRTILGYPGMKMDTHIETYKALRRLPRLMRDFSALQKAVSKTSGND